MKRFEPRIETLIETLERGIGAGATHDVRAELGLRADADDEDVARSLVQIISACDVAMVGEGRTEEPAAEERPESVDEGEGKPTAATSLDTSLLGQSGGDDAGGVEQLDDPETLLGVMRAGSLRQRRAAVRRMVARIEARELRGDEQKAVANALYNARDVELEYELAAAKSVLIGRRAARAEREAWEKRITSLRDDISEFWEAASTGEPVAALEAEKRAQLLLRFRDVPDLIAFHVAALIESEEGAVLEELLTSLRHAGDGRLVPSLGAVLEDSRGAIAIEAARVLRRIDDPRTAPMLAAAYERSPRDAFRAIVGGALADHGDHRALEYVRGLLEREDREVLLAALEALESLGNNEDADAVVKLLEHDDTQIVRHAIRTLARVSDGRSLRALAKLALASSSGSLRALIEEARDTIIARMELRGEEPTDDDTQAIQFQPEEQKPRLGGKRFASWRSFVIGHLWMALGAHKAGLRRFERAAALRPGWYAPHIAMGLAHARADQHAQALSAFRRALEDDRRRVERNPIVIRALARSFIVRAEQVEREGRSDVARGLVSEALRLDLRWASGPQRFELERRRAALGLGAG